MRKIICFLLSSLMLLSPVMAQDPVMQIGPAYIFNPKTPKGAKDYKKRYMGIRMNDLRDSAYFSFPDDVELLGPLFPIDKVKDEKQAQNYIKWIFREIIRTAHGFIHEMPDIGFDPEKHTNHSYYSFLILSLAVPHHESHLMHFRQQETGLCSDRANSLLKASNRIKRVLSPIYKNPAEPLIPECSALEEQDYLNQLVFSYTDADVGIMQVNPYWHKLAMEPAILLNTKNFIRYGIEYLYQGYKKVRTKLGKAEMRAMQALRGQVKPKEAVHAYDCSLYKIPYPPDDSNDSKKIDINREILKVAEAARKKNNRYPMFYDVKGDTQEERQYLREQKMKRLFSLKFYQLLRATWASQYNGSKENICRFVSDNIYDGGFEKTLKGIVVEGLSRYHKFLPENSLEMAAFREILNNYYRIFIPGVGKSSGQEEQTENLRAMLSMSERAHENWQEPERVSRNEPTHTLTDARIPMYISPGAKIEKQCGYLDTRGISGSAIKVLNEEFYNIDGIDKPQRWAEVSVSKYATYLRFHGVKKYVALRDGKNIVNLRSEAGNLSEETKKDQLIRNDEGVSASLEYVGDVLVGKTTWLEMLDEQGQNLFAHGDYVEIIEEEAEAPRSCDLERMYIQSEKLRHLPIEYERGKSYQAVVNGTGSLNVRRCAGTHCDKITEAILSGGDLVTVVGDDSLNGKRIVSWYQVILSDGTKAWVWEPRIDLIEISDD